ncbi:TetR/AcrR family transcriptional regulator C-terminal ligand-binding domain-containing protein [Streptomyces violascens]|uniref:TetR/AcrR family transcriptional regulator C-terminal ligand-binding domain-containing protein n=1 Tax=Streptomyces violascens TaxID=67381 RepID=UPI00364EE99B
MSPPGTPPGTEFAGPARPGGNVHTTRIGLSSAWAAGAVISTAQERARFDTAQMSGKQDIFADIIEQAVGRGEFTGTVDPETAHLLLLGPLASALSIMNLPVDDAMITDLATAATAGITAPGRPSPQRPRRNHRAALTYVAEPVASRRASALDVGASVTRPCVNSTSPRPRWSAGCSLGASLPMRLARRTRWPSRASPRAALAGPPPGRARRCHDRVGQRLPRRSAGTAPPPVTVSPGLCGPARPRTGRGRRRTR